MGAAAFFPAAPGAAFPADARAAYSQQVYYPQPQAGAGGGAGGRGAYDGSYY